MEYVVICDYPYDTIKKFFLTLDEALAYKPPDWITIKEFYKLNHRIYKLKSYKEEEKEDKINRTYIIDYSINS